MIYYSNFSSASGPSDPFFGDTILLLSGDGTNGSDVFTDESAAARGNAFPTGTTQVSTSFKKFGTGSIRVGAAVSNGSINFPDSDDWAFASDDFTIEVFASFDSDKIGSSDQAIIAQWPGLDSGTGAWGLYLTAAGMLSFKASSSGSSPAGSPFPLEASWTPTADTFYHLVVERSGSDWRLYVEGTMLAKISSTLSIANVSGTIILASHRSGGFKIMNGYLDEPRITRGVARYASDSGYTVPSAAFPRS